MFGIAIVIPNILALILPLMFMLSSMAMKISPSPSPLPSSWMPSVSLSSFFVPNCELVRFVELYCRCIVNSFELMKISLLHIKLPIPDYRLFPMPDFIKPTVPPHRLFAGENVKKGWDTVRSKERNVWPDDLCFLHFIDNLASDWINSVWMIIFETYPKKCSRHQLIKVFGSSPLKCGAG